MRIMHYPVRYGIRVATRLTIARDNRVRLRPPPAVLGDACVRAGIFRIHGENIQRDESEIMKRAKSMA